MLIRANWNNEVRHEFDLHSVVNIKIATAKYAENRRRTVESENPSYPMMVRSRTANATDPRGKLYAMLSLVREREIPSLRSDNTLGVEEVYTRLAKSIIQQSQSLNYLGSAGLAIRNHRVPSWVPDWTVQHNPQPIYQTDQRWKHDGTISSQRNILEASKDITPAIAFTSVANERLIARETCFDKVSKVSVPRSWPNDNLDATWKT